MKLLFLFIFSVNLLLSKNDSILVRGIIISGDTFALIILPQVDIEKQMIFKTKRKQEQWSRLKFNVKKVYPYAIIASAKLKEFERVLSTIKDEDDREEYIEKAEEQLKKDFESDLKSLSMNQGRILIKLIDRETGQTSYDLVRRLKGKFSAIMWQSLARLFGSNLKSEYDVNSEEDRLIEIAIRQIESGG